jgi:hypothetical protein
MVKSLKGDAWCVKRVGILMHLVARRRWYGLLLLVALLVGVLIVLFRPSITSPDLPIYQGKPLDYWFGQLPLASVAWVAGSNRVSILPHAAAGGRRYGSTLESPEAPLKAIQEIGTNAIPFVLAKLQRRLSPIQRWIQTVCSKCGMKRPLFADPLELLAERKQAVTALLCLAPLPEEPVVRIQKLCAKGDSEVTVYARAVLTGGDIKRYTNGLMTWNTNLIPDLR